MTEPWVSADVIAEDLGVTKDSIYSWIAKNEARLARRTRVASRC